MERLKLFHSWAFSPTFTQDRMAASYLSPVAHSSRKLSNVDDGMAEAAGVPVGAGSSAAKTLSRSRSGSIGGAGLPNPLSIPPAASNGTFLPDVTTMTPVASGSGAKVRG